MKVKPILQALLVADHVYQDAVTGKWIVAGIFNRIRIVNVKAEPHGEGEHAKVTMQIEAGGHQAGSPFCYLSLTEIRGEQAFKLRYVDLNNDLLLFQTEFGARADSPLATAEAGVPLPVLPATKPGTFALELLWNDEPLGSYRIIIEEISEGDDDGNEPA